MLPSCFVPGANFDFKANQNKRTHYQINIWASPYLVELRMLIEGEARDVEFLGYVKKVWGR